MRSYTMSSPSGPDSYLERPFSSVPPLSSGARRRIRKGLPCRQAIREDFVIETEKKGD